MLPSRDFTPAPVRPASPPRNYLVSHNNSTVPVNFTVLQPPPVNQTIPPPPFNNNPVAFPSPNITTESTTNLTNSADLSPVPVNRTVTSTPEPEDYTVVAPSRYSTADSPKHIEFSPAFGDFSGVSATEKMDEANVPAIEENRGSEKCGASDDETKQCPLKEGETELEHVREGDDCMVRDYMTEHTL